MSLQKVKVGKVEWIHIEHPNDDDIGYLRENFKFHELHYEDCISDEEYTRVDTFDGYHFIILQFAQWHLHGAELTNNEVDVFVSKNYIITVNHSNKQLEKMAADFFANKNLVKSYLKEGTGMLLYRIMKISSDASFGVLYDLQHKLGELELRVLDSKDSHDYLHQILLAKKNILHFRRIVTNQLDLIKELVERFKNFEEGFSKTHLNDLRDSITRISSLVELAHDTIVALESTNEALLTRNTNNVIKALTFFSVVMLPLTVISGVYGMNLDTLPFAKSEHSFMIVIGVMVSVVLGMLAVFKWRKWL